jgi:hypothetical protein
MSVFILKSELRDDDAGTSSSTRAGLPLARHIPFHHDLQKHHNSDCRPGKLRNASDGQESCLQCIFVQVLTF